MGLCFVKFLYICQYPGLTLESGGWSRWWWCRTKQCGRKWRCCRRRRIRRGHKGNDSGWCWTRRRRRCERPRCGRQWGWQCRSESHARDDGQWWRRRSWWCQLFCRCSRRRRIRGRDFQDWIMMFSVCVPARHRQYAPQTQDFFTLVRVFVLMVVKEMNVYIYIYKQGRAPQKHPSAL